MAYGGLLRLVEALEQLLGRGPAPRAGCRLAVVAIASLFATGTAFAQTAAPAAKADAKTTTAAPTDKKDTPADKKDDKKP